MLAVRASAASGSIRITSVKWAKASAACPVVRAIWPTQREWMTAVGIAVGRSRDSIDDSARAARVSLKNRRGLMGGMVSSSLGVARTRGKNPSRTAAAGANARATAAIAGDRADDDGV